VWKLLEAWGPQGWSHHLASLRGLYSRKAAVLVAAVRKHLGGVARWVGGVPQAGM
jgi:DNA-binding transcriptional MocR family regulator